MSPEPWRRIASALVDGVAAEYGDARVDVVVDPVVGRVVARLTYRGEPVASHAMPENVLLVRLPREPEAAGLALEAVKAFLERHREARVAPA